MFKFTIRYAVSRISLKHRPKCYTKSPTAQDAYWPIPHQVHWGDCMQLRVQESRNKAPLPLASLVYSYMQLIALTTQVNSVPWQLTSHATWADEPFKHLHITAHPQILVLELQVPMGACPGQYSICMMTHISATWFCYSQVRVHCTHMHISTTSFLTVVRTTRCGILFVPQDNMVYCLYHKIIWCTVCTTR